MLNPFDFWLVKKWPEDIFFLIDKYWNWANPLIYDDNIVHSGKKELYKFANSNILILGGGPSTNEYLQDKFLFDSHDYTWSMNHFFLNKHISNHKIDLAMIMPGVDLNNEDFNRKIKLDDTILGIEIHDKWIDNEQFKKFVEKYEDKMFFSHTKFFGKLGVGARMIILAASLGAASVSFIGFDGPVKGHSFEENKYKLPVDVTEQNAQQIYSYQYDILWDYLTEKFPNTKIISLDKTNILHKKIWNI